MAEKLTFISFADRANTLHNNKFDYSLVDYVNTTTKVKIVCPVHGTFEQTPKAHLQGQGCMKCSVEAKTFDRDSIISKLSLQFDNQYDYKETVFGAGNEKINVVCKDHGMFSVAYVNHYYKGKGCKQCWLDRHTWTQAEFVTQSKLIHDNFYDYSNTRFTHTRIKVKITCPEHGEFEQEPQFHLNGSGCSSCNESVGERKIATYLKMNNITFIREKTFEDCLSPKNYKLRFDFYIPSLNTCIEFDGLQHEQEVKYWGKETFENTKCNDEIKNKYCNEKGIKLIRIKYKQRKEVENILVASGIILDLCISQNETIAA